MSSGESSERAASEAVQGTPGISRSRSRSNHGIDSRAAFVARLTELSAAEHVSSSDRPRVTGIHHLKFAVSNLDVSIAWYERVLGATRIPSLDRVRDDATRFAAVCEMVDWTGLYLELRQTEDQAQKARGWDPIALSVRGRQDLVKWVQWLNRWGTKHSRVLTGVKGWLLVFEVSSRKASRRLCRN